MEWVDTSPMYILPRQLVQCERTHTHTIAASNLQSELIGIVRLLFIVVQAWKNNLLAHQEKISL